MGKNVLFNNVVSQNPDILYRQDKRLKARLTRLKIDIF